MGKEKKLFKSEEYKNTSEVSAFLQQLASKIAEGRIVLRQGDQEIILQLPENLREGHIRRKFELELKWYEDEDGSQPVAGNTADDPLYVPAVDRVLQIIEGIGLLFVGDCKMSALDTRTHIHHRQQHSAAEFI
jgi:amphi-Trp domain-containing protein